MPFGIWISLKLSSKANFHCLTLACFCVTGFGTRFAGCMGRHGLQQRLTKHRVRLTRFASPFNASFQWSKEHTHSMIRAIIGSGWQESLQCAAAALSAASLVISLTLASWWQELCLPPSGERVQQMLGAFVTLGAGLNDS